LNAAPAALLVDPPGEKLLSHESPDGVDAQAALKAAPPGSRDPVRIDSATVAALLARPQSPPQIIKDATVSFADAYAALISSEGQSLIVRRDRLFAAVEAAERLPATEQYDAKKQLADYYSRGSAVTGKGE
jgi:hypothetical protein